MKIVILSEWYSEKMGYAENFLPKALGKIGHEVHLVTTDLQVYATTADYEKIYLDHLGPKQVQQGVFRKDFFTLHRNPHTLSGDLGIMGLEDKLAKIRPDIVYCFEIFNRDTRLASVLKSKYGYKLFCESRMHLSVFSPTRSPLRKIRQYITWINGRLLSKRIDAFYPIAPDVNHIIVKYFGIPRNKCKLSSLAVDTDLFSYDRKYGASRDLRKSLGFTEEDVVCLYTGRFTESKGPLILAHAIEYLQRTGHTEFKALFLGQGDKEYGDMLASMRGCKISPYVNVNELPNFYRSFDIGVWPLQESTSQLDAACGMPIIINEKVEDNFRTNGNGLRYIDRDFKDLAAKILSLKDKLTRDKMGVIGSDKISKYYSWDQLAANKIADFKRYLD